MIDWSDLGLRLGILITLMLSLLPSVGGTRASLIAHTGSPVIHGRVSGTLYAYVYNSLHYTSHYSKGTRITRPCLSGQVVFQGDVKPKLPVSRMYPLRRWGGGGSLYLCCRTVQNHFFNRKKKTPEIKLSEQ